MATYTIYAGTEDGSMYSSNSTYSTARSGSLFGVQTSNAAAYVGQVLAGGIYYCYEAFHAFDTSSVTGSVESVTLGVNVTTDFSTQDFTLNARGYDWGTTVTSGDWIAGASLSNNPLRATLSTSSIGTGAKSFTSDSSFAANTADPVRIVVASSRLEGNNAPGASDERIEYNCADASGTTNDPKLTIVTYDPPVFANMAPRIPAEVY